MLRLIIIDGWGYFGGVAIITSDYGNCEERADFPTGEPNNLYSANTVPFHFVDVWANGLKLRDGSALKDIAPTLLGIQKPEEMTGYDLRKS